MVEQTHNDFESAYDAGRDCALHGATKANCHFRFFATPENTGEWQRGKVSAETDSNTERRIRGLERGLGNNA